jgi:uncharacterized protein YbjT (DUF2867 family)
MKILLTGATGYIASRLLPFLLAQGHEVTCCVRDQQRFNADRYPGARLTVIEVNLLDPISLEKIPDDIDAAYYLVHSMTVSDGDFKALEQQSAENFRQRLEKTRVRQVIYLSGISNENVLSKHLASRKAVENCLQSTQYFLTVLRAGIIIGSGSASFEIIRDLVEKLPVMIAPRWLNTKSNPIAVTNVMEFLSGVLLNPATFNQCYDIYGPEVLTYKEMLLRFARVRHLKRRIFIVPVMTPKLSSYWLFFVTSTSYPLAKNLVDSMKVEVIGRKNTLAEMLDITLIDFETAIIKAFGKIEQNMIVSSWKEALNSDVLSKGISSYIEVPVNGCFRDVRSAPVVHITQTLHNIFSIGGSTGWYYGNWLWGLRGFIDKLFGGVGLRRGRRHPHEIYTGESLDFWRVIYASQPEKRLLLYAEMKLPGEAWLEFNISEDNVLHQTATFRPRGLAGRLYWYAVLPFHGFIFRGMIKALINN